MVGVRTWRTCAMKYANRAHEQSETLRLDSSTLHNNQVQ